MEQPFFSIIIPTYKRPQALESCLAALSRLKYPRDRFEVIVVNDGDVNLPDSVTAPYLPQLNIQLLFQANTGPAGARNTGANRARGKFLAFTDDDCRPAPDWLNVLAAHWHRVEDSDRTAIGGNVVNALPNNIYATASQLHGDAVYAYFNQAHGDSTFFASCNFSVSRQAYQRLGGFDQRFPIAAGEDRAFCDRWLRAGYLLRYVPEARVDHAHHLTLPSFFKQHFNYGRGAFFFHQAREEEAAVPVKTDLKFYRHLILYPFQVAPFKATSLFRALLLCALFVGCNLAKTAGFFWERLKQPFFPTPFDGPFDGSLSTPL